MIIMTDEEYNFLLFDIIEKIKSINQEYDLEKNAYLSFSGGKDSTVLHYLIDLALPNNKIPRLYINTGIEYADVVNFVREMAEADERIKIINSGVNIKKMLEENGYPFKSKEHSLKVHYYQRGLMPKYVSNYISRGKKFGCPIKLLYQFEKDFCLKISDLCCHKLKKDVAKKWFKENNKQITLTGMRNEEGGQRANKGCTVFRNGKLLKFHPLMTMKENFVDIFVLKNNIKLCKLYYQPYNFKRTGCKGCPFSLDLQEQLDVMEHLLPKERKQCEAIWKPVYDEYRRIGYRLRKYNLFDYLRENKIDRR